MEGAPLRTVPRRPEGPVDAAEAVRHVGGRLPDLDEMGRAALALVEIAGRSRAEVAAEREVPRDEIAAALARARKTLRRSLFPLPGSGWCERAERYISDRLDGELAPPGPARLEMHLRNCPRCVDHERRLDQARDDLVASFVESTEPTEPAPQPAPEPEPEPEPEPPPPELRVVEPEVTAPPAAAAPPATVPTESVPVPLRRTPGRRVASLAWNGLFAVAVLLALASILIAVLGLLGGSIS